MEPTELPGVFAQSRNRDFWVRSPVGAEGDEVEGLVKKGRRGKLSGAGKTMHRTTEGSAGSSVRANKGMSRHLQAHIGRHLRETFNQVAREPLPDRLLQLLKNLDQNGDK
jgi:hypothetical protein